MLSKFSTSKNLAGLFLMSLLLLILPGCLATRGWVNQQLKPVGTRVTNVEQEMSETKSRVAGVDPRFAETVSQQLKHFGTRVASAETRVHGMENRLASTEHYIKQVSSKNGKTQMDFKDLRLERRLVIDLKQGANFLPNSATLLEPAKKKIDQFLINLKRQPVRDHLFFVAGYTDSMGSSDQNYELGRERANSVGRYLIVKKAIHPTRVIMVSGGDRNPAADNATHEGRVKNRRVEILVYKEVLTRVMPEIAATISRMAVTPKIARGH